MTTLLFKTEVFTLEIFSSFGQWKAFFFFHQLRCTLRKKQNKSCHWGGKSTNMYHLGTNVQPLGTNM